MKSPEHPLVSVASSISSYKEGNRQMTIVKASSIRMEHRRGDWGPWTLSADYCLVKHHPNGSIAYEIDLEGCTDSPQVLDWICQVAGKSWADDSTLAGLVRAFDDTLRPQASLCSMGVGSTLTPAQIRKKARRVPSAPARPSEDVDPHTDSGTPATCFTAWLVDHEAAHTRVGDLARDVAADPDWPAHAGRHEQAGYMRDVGACDAAVEAHEHARRLWRTEHARPSASPRR